MGMATPSETDEVVLPVAALTIACDDFRYAAQTFRTETLLSRQRSSVTSDFDGRPFARSRYVVRAALATSASAG